MTQVTQKQTGYIKALIEKKLSFWTTDNHAAQEVASRFISTANRAARKNAYPDRNADGAREGLRAMGIEQRANLSRDIDALINENHSKFESMRIPATMEEASEMIDALKGAW